MTSKFLPRLLSLPTKQSFFLLGPRQVGKSALIRNYFSEFKLLKYNLLIQEELLRLTQNPQLFRTEVMTRNPNITHVFIDEVQKLPRLLDEVHYILEETKNPPFFILTGSSARKLKRNKANMLGGRAYDLNLAPLTYKEITNALGEEMFSEHKALCYGTLPAVYLAEGKDDAIKTLQAYTNIYIKEEIQEEALVRNLGAFTGFLRLAAEENGHLLNFTNLSQDLGVSSNTIQSYYQILEDTLMGFMLRPFAASSRRSLVKRPKFYFFDTGVQRALNKELSIELDVGTKRFGDVFEHFFIKEMIYLARYINPEYEFSFYRTENDAEIDLIVKTPCKTIYAIEIKSSTAPSLQELSGFKSFREICPDAKLICACRCPRPYKLGDIEILPWTTVFDKVLTL
jgi:predicted AAA+ superfamily ATPase